jgi:hypothetical protein
MSPGRARKTAAHRLARKDAKYLSRKLPSVSDVFIGGSNQALVRGVSNSGRSLNLSRTSMNSYAGTSTSINLSRSGSRLLRVINSHWNVGAVQPMT